MYSFGVLCYEVLTRSKPFHGITDENELADKLHTGQGLDVQLLPVEVSPAVLTMIKVCLVTHH
jgi:hypothetical protein